MLKNYFVVAWRNLARNKAFSMINILGLALGIACSLLIMLWVKDERSFDAFHEHGSQLYQVYERWHFDGKEEASYPTQGLLAEELQRIVPEIVYASSMDRASAPGSLSTFEANSKINKMEGVFVGNDFLRMFSFPVLQGSAMNALNRPEAIAISHKMADLFFGSPANAIGKTMRFENKEDLEVTAVFENVPANSSLQFDFLRSWMAFVQQNDWVHNWGNTSPATFVQLRTDANPEKVEAKIKDFLYHFQQKQSSVYTELALQPFKDKYLHSTFKNGSIDGGRIEYVQLFTWIAIFIILIACINFMNLATARAVNRSKEVGVRKVVGAPRKALIKQFIGEAILLTFLSTLAGLFLADLLIPFFNQLTGKQLSLPFTEISFWLMLVCIPLITGIIAGSYPALFLSSLKPVSILKSSLKFSPGSVNFRKGLVIFQFTLSVILIAGMIIIYRQVNYIQTKNLGYDRENLLYIPIEGDLVKNYSLFKEEALSAPGVLSVSKMRNSPTVIEHHTGSIDWEGKDPNLTVSFADAVVGYDYVKTMKLNLKEGRDFSADYGTDSASYLLNETAAARMNYDHALGKTVRWGNRPGKIIGILKDFHFNSMHQAIDPLIVRLDDQWGWGTILVRLKANQTKDAISTLQSVCKKLNPKFPFTYQFSDEEYSKLYRSEQLVSKLSDYFAFLAIFISCLGLFGLATFSANQRIKEIGVRKVLGASVTDIVTMLTINFLKPVAISILIAIPVSLYLMRHWLNNFAYKIDMEWWMFAAAGILALIIALLTISFQSVRAAVSNPAKSLRSE